MDPVEGRARATAEMYEIPLWYEDYDQMLEEGDLDMVVIASPIGVHHKQGLKAVQMGKHVHFNKTMTTTKAEADEIIEAAKGMGVKLVASPGEMQMPVYQEARRLLMEECIIGHIYYALLGGGMLHEYEPFREGSDVLSNVNPLWYYRRPGGGPMYDGVVYSLHGLTGILGAAKRVVGMSGIGLRERSFKEHRVTVDMDDNTHLLLDFGDGTFANVYGAFTVNVRRPASLQFAGSEGRLELSARGFTLSTHRAKSLFGVRGGVFESGEHAGHTEMPYLNAAHRALPECHVFSDIMHLVDCVLSDKAPAVTAEHARHVIEIIEAGYRSSEAGVAVELTTTF